MNNYSVNGKPVKLTFAAVGENVLRVSVLPSGKAVRNVFTTVDLSEREWPEPDIVFNKSPGQSEFGAGPFTVKLNDLEFEIFKGQKKIQKLSVCPKTGFVSFALGQGEKLYGLGQGYKSHVDRRGTRYDLSLNGQIPGYIENYSAMSPVGYVIGNGWALFFHQPWKGILDLTGSEGVFEKDQREYCDVFVFNIDKPQDAAPEYYSLTGLPPLPPKYAFGYMQSYRTLLFNGEEQVLSSAKYMRDNDIPCDILVYLGTGYCDNGWNVYNGKFAWHPAVFPNPEKIMEELHNMGYKVCLHVTRCPASLHGKLGKDPSLSPLEYDHVENYWQKHRELYATAKNEAWWPDDGDEIDVIARLTRQKLYYEGCLELEPDRRPFYLNRNSSPGHTKWGGIIWSGDVVSEWETLKNHIPLGLNVGVSSTPYWSSDTGGFFSSPEYDGELLIRWFQYNTFTPFLRNHGRPSFLHNTWGWTKFKKLDEIPLEISNGNVKGEGPIKEEAMGDERVEPICRKFIHERYKLLPYLYTLAWEASLKGLPIMRPLWVSYPDDPIAVNMGNEYMLGQNLLVSPVTAKGAVEWPVYFPKGKGSTDLWYGYWTMKEYEGGKTVTVPAALDSIPVFVPAGGIIVKAPVVPYLDIKPKKEFEEISIEVYTGADGSYLLYEDDGISLGYMKGENTITDIRWDDRSRTLSARGKSTLMPGKSREVKATLHPSGEKKSFRIDYE